MELRKKSKQRTKNCERSDKEGKKERPERGRGTGRKELACASSRLFPCLHVCTFLDLFGRHFQTRQVAPAKEVRLTDTPRPTFPIGVGLSVNCEVLQNTWCEVWLKRISYSARRTCGELWAPDDLHVIVGRLDAHSRTVAWPISKRHLTSLTSGNTGTGFEVLYYRQCGLAS